MSRRVAALDLGSNTLELLVLEARPDAPPRPVLVDERIPRVSEGVEARGALDPAAARRALDALGELAAAARACGAERVEGVATAGLRGLPEAEGFLAAAHAETGVRVRLIDGAEEARLAFRSSALRFPGRRWVLDVGGRSTELAFGSGHTPARSWSLEVGGVRLKERFAPPDPPGPSDLEGVRAHLREALAPLAAHAVPGAPVVGVSGTALAALGLERGEREIERVLELAATGSVELDAIRALRERLARLPAVERVFGTVLPPRRADVVVLGLLVVEAALEALGADALHTCFGGVAAGLAAELLEAAVS